MTHLTPITISAAKSNYDGFLLPDAAHALYVADGFALLIAVVPDVGKYLQVREAFVVSIKAEATFVFIADLYRRLTEVSAYELLTRHYDEEFDAFDIPLE
ncbi:hypothetical protein [Paenibacillus sp. PL91]|uniref:hypothetical protein n=1 Tax=Paenibacillus sp. PL91 TaxID=2729538 RepID=UPI00145E2520|nr:hypothetical protein [Paenibacillus sp. PL91]MBC9199777.1 hypothetical protein [Paenibacillus sp. PL91]